MAAKSDASRPSRKRAAPVRADATQDDLSATAETPNPTSVLEAFGFHLPALDGSSRYEIFDEIGRGGVARVFLGFDRALQRQVALKTLRKRLTRDRQAVGLFLNEAKITAKLQHPGIVPIHDIGILSSGEIYFAMEKVEGCTLRQVLEELGEGRRSFDHVMRIFEQVCHIVAYAHSQGVVHRDLKPDNIMIGGFRDVFVMDWGIARDLTAPLNEAPAIVIGDDGEVSEPGETRKERQVKGTPRYMSPEQTLGMDQQVDPHSDVFSLGLILYEILAGRHPFERDSIRDTLHAIRNEAVPPITSRAIGADLKSICAHALERVPQDRYANAGKLALDVSAALSHHPVSAHEATLMERAFKLVRRHQTAAALVLCALTAIAFILSTQYVRSRQAQELLYRARELISASQATDVRVRQLQDLLRTADASERGVLASQLNRQQHKSREQLAGAQALLAAAWQRHPPACPEWAINWLKQLSLARIQDDLELSDFDAARAHLADLQALIERSNGSLTWTDDERTALQAIRRQLAKPSVAVPGLTPAS